MTDAEKLLLCATMTPGDAIETIAEDGSWWTLHNQRIKAQVEARDALAAALINRWRYCRCKDHFCDACEQSAAVLDAYASGWRKLK